MTQQGQERGTDTELATEAARVATSWILAEGPLTEEQGGKLVALQRPDSAQEETYTWDQVRSWAQRLSEVTTGQDRDHARDTTREATLTMRDWLKETLNHAAEHEGPEEQSAARTRLRDFIDAHGRTDQAYPSP